MNRTYREQSKLPKEVWIYLFYCVVLNERIVGSWHSYLFSSWTLTSSLSLLVNIFLCKQLPSSTTFGSILDWPPAFSSFLFLKSRVTMTLLLLCFLVASWATAEQTNEFVVFLWILTCIIYISVVSVPEVNISVLLEYSSPF